MVQRQSKPETTSADEAAVPAGSFAPSTDRLYDLVHRTSGIERSVTYLEAHVEKIDAKLDSISHEITAAKATFGALKFIGVGILIGIWGLISALAIAWAIHHFHWAGG